MYFFTYSFFLPVMQCSFFMFFYLCYHEKIAFFFSLFNLIPFGSVKFSFADNVVDDTEEIRATDHQFSLLVIFIDFF